MSCFLGVTNRTTLIICLYCIIIPNRIISSSAGIVVGSRGPFSKFSAAQSVLPDSERPIDGHSHEVGLTPRCFGPLGLSDWNSTFGSRILVGRRFRPDQVELGLGLEKLRASRHVIRESGWGRSPVRMGLRLLVMGWIGVYWLKLGLGLNNWMGYWHVKAHFSCLVSLSRFYVIFKGLHSL